LDNLDRSYGHALALRGKLEALEPLPVSIGPIDPNAVPRAVQEFIGPVYAEMVGLLGRRTRTEGLQYAGGEPEHA